MRFAGPCDRKSTQKRTVGLTMQIRATLQFSGKISGCLLEDRLSPPPDLLDPVLPCHGVANGGRMAPKTGSS